MNSNIETNENDGLIIGIDIQKLYSQICWYDYDNKICEPVVSDENEAFICNPNEVCELFNTPRGLDYEYTKELAEFIFNLIELTKHKCQRMKVEKVCITVEIFEKYILDRLKVALNSLIMPKEQWILISHEECYAYYAFSQKHELYSSGVMLLDYTIDGLHTYRMNIGKIQDKNVIMEKRVTFDDNKILDVVQGRKSFADVSEHIMEIVRGVMPDRSLSSVYLTGVGFDIPEFPMEFARMLCTGRKAFVGQNLFVKGACYCAYEEINSDLFKNVLLACYNRITTGVELDIIERGVPRRFRLVRTGINWYMADRNIDFILDDITKIRFILRSCDSSEEYEEVIDISEIPYREGRITRINMNVTFENDSKMVVTITDRGFGDFAKSSGRVIKKEIYLDTERKVSEGEA